MRVGRAIHRLLKSPFGSTLTAMIRPRFALIAHVALAAATSVAAGTFRFEPGGAVALSIDPSEETPTAESLEGKAGRPAWGEADSLTLNLTAGWVGDFDRTDLFTPTLGLSWFPVRNFSLDLELDGVLAWQPGDDAGGGGVAIMLRWHFLARESWTVFVDAGAGILGATEPIPAGGSRFNFTPRAGVGGTYALDRMTRLIGGVRWFHISNAETSGDNPAFDGLQVYAGVSWGF